MPTRFSRSAPAPRGLKLGAIAFLCFLAVIGSMLGVVLIPIGAVPAAMFGLLGGLVVGWFVILVRRRGPSRTFPACRQEGRGHERYCRLSLRRRRLRRR